MSDKKLWEFNCPQFVDFATGLENRSPANDIWIGTSNFETPTSIVRHESRVLCPRMATPKSRSHKALNNSPFVNTVRPVKTDDEKLAVLSKLPHRESRSDGFLNRVGKNVKFPHKVLGHGFKKSLSDCCVRAKKKVYPTTPMCLKRTLNKAKFKKIKTTEELEMEKIAELRNKLAQHLRLNEVNFKRLKCNKTPYGMEKLFSKEVKASNVHELKKDFKPPVTELDGFGKNYRKSRFAEGKNVGVLSGALKWKSQAENLKEKSKKLQAILVPPPKSSVHSNALRTVNTVNAGEKSHPQKLSPLLQYKAYGGLMFNPNQDKKTVPQPFSFDTSSSISFQDASFRVKDLKAKCSTSSKATLVENKENILSISLSRAEIKVEKKNVKKMLVTEIPESSSFKHQYKRYMK